MNSPVKLRFHKLILPGRKFTPSFCAMLQSASVQKEEVHRLNESSRRVIQTHGTVHVLPTKEELEAFSYSVSHDLHARRYEPLTDTHKSL